MGKRLVQVKFSHAIEEYSYEMKAMNRSDHTIEDYMLAYRHWLRLMGDTILSEVKRADVVKFFYLMGEENVSQGGVAPRPLRKRTNKTLSNYHIGLSALWTWAVTVGYATEHVIRQFEPPIPEENPIIPYTDEETVVMVKACATGKPWRNNPLTESERATTERDQAIILVLLDTGVRNSELCGIKLSEVDFSNNRIFIHGKGKKQRYVGFGPITARYIRRWLHKRPKIADRCGGYLFCNVINYKGHPLKRDSLGRLIKRIAKRAGVADANVHRFRHTCAIRRLQNGMNVFELQKLLGHSNLSTTKRYVHLAQLDLDEAMRRTNPVDTLRI